MPRPSSGRSEDLVREDRKGRGKRNLPLVDDARVLPVQPCGGGPGVGEPVEGDVVEDVVSCEACGATCEDARDQLVAARFVIDHPGSQADGGIGQAVTDRLRARRLLDEVAATHREEGLLLLVGRLLLLGELGGGRLAQGERPPDFRRDAQEQVHVDAQQPLRRQVRQCLRDPRAPVAALRHVLRVAQALHQRVPRARDAVGVPADVLRLARKPVAGHRRDNEMERVRGVAAVRGRVGKRLDDLQLLDDRAGPAVRDDQRQRVVVLRPNVDEMDVQPIDLGHELRQGIQPRLALAPVVLRRPVAREFLNRRRLHALRLISDSLLVGEARRPDPSAKVVQLLLRHVNVEGANLDGGLAGVAHVALRCWWGRRST